MYNVMRVRLRRCGGDSFEYNCSDGVREVVAKEYVHLSVSGGGWMCTQYERLNSGNENHAETGLLASNIQGALNHRAHRCTHMGGHKCSHTRVPARAHTQQYTCMRATGKHKNRQFANPREVYGLGSFTLFVEAKAIGKLCCPVTNEANVQRDVGQLRT